MLEINSKNCKEFGFIATRHDCPECGYCYFQNGAQYRGKKCRDFDCSPSEEEGYIFHPIDWPGSNMAGGTAP